ncbi:aspartyl-tRNA(Asn)/glutamyl-tRNA(Gln) amidotransferase subunit A [Bradyrhizobium yuanmingense]|uniref:Aspartyl-tRNA(Asn)/glutamyl-tRNA(Gln) amidotransferase subunit A n=1 Tax=Bradyrhizobium yuanmingense TaxID=108015 RepID=A0A1C3WS80_9BRAD|nr:amidase family protein [Bradyrhizobium yuanmingense]MCA1384387.1 amidase [Bradyrhizobium sp. BRP05]TWI23333.1 aspartyl-tRNA(Asn)/glutamyl-tRNA(Gln) amidotransferase subunit A [Bradyrhizobium yuanmingense]SCB42923.1 aspartyl-tRNA(Asn)/glutamyl-tRNA(Gln) amidotransferase subunit A [Bradyrhizobium yuanmingense]
MTATKDPSHPSAVARLEAALARIHSPEATNVFTAVFADSARWEAEAAERRAAAGASRGPLDGCIISVKALFDVAGTVTSSGSAVLRRLPPAVEDAEVVKRLRAAGAIVIGKTQMTEFAFSALGTNPHDGMPGNPRDRSRVPGGSSAGAVVSVIGGMADIAIGSDTGGSLRIPAALSGAVGFKPTSGFVPTAGAFSLSSSLDTIGPIAANVEECFVADQVLSGESTPSRLKSASPGTFRLIIARGRLFDRCEPEVLAAFENAMERLRSGGLQIKDGSIEAALDDVAQIDKIGTFPSIEVGATLRGLGLSELDGIDPRTRVRIEAGAGILGTDYVCMMRLRQAAIRSFDQYFSNNEVFVLPTTPVRAPLISSVAEDAAFHELNGLVLRNPRVANLLDCPSISLPLPLDGLPVGLMLIGRRNADRRLVEIAASVEALLRGHLHAA